MIDFIYSHCETIFNCLVWFVVIYFLAFFFTQHGKNLANKQLLLFLNAAIKKNMKSDKWISVEDSLPGKNEFFLGICQPGLIDIFKCEEVENNYVFMRTDCRNPVKGITHWMELPESPYEI